MEHLSNHEDRPSQHENRHKLCNEMGQPLLSLLESQCKLRQQHDQNIPNGGKAIAEQILAIRRKKEIQKCRIVRVTVRDPSRKVNHLIKVI